MAGERPSDMQDLYCLSADGGGDDDGDNGGDDDGGDDDGNDCNENTKMCCRKENGAGSLTLGQFHFSVLILLMLLLQS